MLSTAAILSLALQCAPTIHPDTVLDVAKLESALHPYAIGIVGERGRFPQDKAAALEHVRQLARDGKNYSVGLMQINQTNFARYGMTAEDLFSPCNNLSVFERILTDCYQRGGNLKNALSCYYSGNFKTGQKKEADFANTSYVERIGYRVPSTQEDQKQGASATVGVVVDAPVRVIYPERVLKGRVVAVEQPTKMVKE